MQAFKLKGTVTADRKLTLDLPQDIQPGTVEVLVLREENSSPENLADVLEDAESFGGEGQALSTLDERLNAERDSWK